MGIPDGIERGEDGQARCWWCGLDPLYRRYHDEEWGRPVHEDRRLFEKICLEGFQSGLSWLTILKKRENFRRAFAEFDIERVARFNRRSVERLLRDAGIVRHRGKIESTIHNAKRALELIAEHGSLATWFWQFVPPPTERPKRMTKAALMTLGKTPTSIALSRELKRRDWTYVGPTTVYAFMQAMGLVNDHLEGCHVRAAVADARDQ
ncbi:MAG: DNA-3-methyladenine glycosylase I [Planctomycetota bacterium]|nr:DNA-3-methyladenine glycosylase I [Planctomycetota bacterium]